MAVFLYKALDEAGKRVSGALEADSVDAATRALTDRGYIPTRVEEQHAGTLANNWLSVRQRFSHVSAPELIVFTKQFSTMLRSGVSMRRILGILEDQADNAKLKVVARMLSRDVESGSRLSDAFRKHPETFSPLYCSMMEAGEAGGALPAVLDRLVYVLGHEHQVRSEVKAALQYPATVLLSLVVAFVILLTAVVPKFARLFEQGGVPLPGPTRVCMFVSDIVLRHWVLLVVVLVAVLVALRQYLRTSQGKFVRDAFLLNVPILGPVLRKAAISQFASVFAIFQSSGVSILDAMRILSQTMDNAAVARDLEMVGELLEQGRGMAEPLRQVRYFSPMLINMVAVGEESGDLESMLREVAAHYDVEVEYAMKKLVGALGPLLTIGLAVVVGFFALAIYMPMWDLAKTIK